MRIGNKQINTELASFGLSDGARRGGARGLRRRRGGRDLYGQFSKARSGQVGPDPGRFELSEGISKRARATILGFWDPKFELMRIELVRTDCAILYRFRGIDHVVFNDWYDQDYKDADAPSGSDRC